MMVRFLIVAVSSGLLFGVLDGLIHANPLAQRLYEVYKPIARTSVNAPVGIVIDLVYGFALAGLFLLLYDRLPGSSGLAKGLSYGLGLWFLRVLMSAASTWMMFTVPLTTIGYDLAAGLLEMLAIGVLYGLALVPVG